MKKIGLMSPALGPANYKPFLNICEILHEINSDVFIIYSSSENILINKNYNMHFIRYNLIPNFMRPNLIKNLVKYILNRIIKIKKIIQLKSNVNIWILFMGEKSLFIFLFLKIIRKKIIIIMAGNYVKELKINKNFIGFLYLINRKIILQFADYINIYSERFIPEWNLTPYRHKILIAHRHFLDFTTFTVTTPYHDRPPLIGYIGRLSGEKGVQHFAEALPAILSNHQDFHVLIGGDGQLKQEIEASLQEGGIADCVDLPGWISHDELPKYLNQLRLLVLPSYTEGLPNIMLEAMACGTPVLATPVGAIPDVIRDGETGFIMEDNSPECIARNVIRALNDPHLGEIAERGRAFVKEEFTVEKVVERWKGILKDIE